MFNDLSSPASLLQTRRSGKPRDMVAPGPSSEQMARILSAAMRVPDHGKLAPWRFVIVDTDQRDALSALLTSAYLSEKPDAGRLEVESMDQFARQAPALVVVMSSPVQGSKIPVWEQELSCGAACMNLVTATSAEGFVAGWLTGWPSYNETVRDAFGRPGERIAGFVFIGTPSRPLEERPRPQYEAVVRHWQPGQEKG
jgi:nitroreductase